MKNPDNLLVLWTSGDREVALKMVFMYTYNSKRFFGWENVTLLVWGPSAKLLTEDEELQKCVKTMRESGVRVIACKSCAEGFGIVDALEALDAEVFYTGEFLTEWLKSDKKMLAL